MKLGSYIIHLTGGGPGHFGQSYTKYYPILPRKFILAREACGNNLYCFIPSSLVAKHEFQYIEIGLQQ